MLRRVTSAESISLNAWDVLSFNVTVIVQVDIQAGDVLGFRLVEQGDDDRIEHLPLLYKPGPNLDSSWTVPWWSTSKWAGVENNFIVVNSRAGTEWLLTVNVHVWLQATTSMSTSR